MSTVQLQLSDDDLDGLRDEVKQMVTNGIQDAVKDYEATDDVLSSVKAIENFLHCSYKTYKKLVTHGMPIHKYGSLIFGSKQEILTWIRTSGDKID